MWGFLGYSTKPCQPNSSCSFSKAKCLTSYCHNLPNCTFQCANYTSICTSPVQTALGFQAGDGKFDLEQTAAVKLPQNAGLEPSSVNPLKHALQNPLRNQRLNPLKFRQEKAHKLLTHNLFENSVNPGTTSRLTRTKCLFSWFRSRTHKLFCPVNRPVVPGSTGP